VNGSDPEGLWGLNPISDVAQAWDDTGGKFENFWYQTGYQDGPGLCSIDAFYSSACSKNSSIANPVIEIAGGLIPGDEEAGAAEPEANSVASGVNLGRQLASESQVSSSGTGFAGVGCKSDFNGADAAAAKYGGGPLDWYKMSSESYEDQTGRQFETHWIENVTTGRQEEFKTKIIRW
jgi:hypothetical protein